MPKHHYILKMEAVIKLILSPEREGRALNRDVLGKYIEEIESIVRDRLTQMRLGDSITSISCEKASYTEANELPVLVRMKFDSETKKSSGLNKISNFAPLGGEIDQETLGGNYNVDVLFEGFKILVLGTS